MRRGIYLLIAAGLIGASLWARRPIDTERFCKAGVPIGELSQEHLVPEIGLLAPLASWIPLFLSSP